MRYVLSDSLSTLIYSCCWNEKTVRQVLRDDDDQLSSEAGYMLSDTFKQAG